MPQERWLTQSKIPMKSLQDVSQHNLKRNLFPAKESQEGRELPPRPRSQQHPLIICSHIPRSSSKIAAHHNAQSRVTHFGSNKEDEPASSCEEDERHALLEELEDVSAQLRNLTANQVCISYCGASLLTCMHSMTSMRQIFICLQGIPTRHGGCRRGSRSDLSKEVEAAQRNMKQLLGRLHVLAKVHDLKLQSIQVLVVI